MAVGGAPAAALLYQETADSIAARALAAEQRRLGVEPATSQEHGRPTKRDRRDLEKANGRQVNKGWDNRWSASVDGD